MAIDTRDKMASAGWRFPANLLPNPDGDTSLGAADRLHMAGFYSGILASGAFQAGAFNVGKVGMFVPGGTVHGVFVPGAVRHGVDV